MVVAIEKDKRAKQKRFFLFKKLFKTVLLLITMMVSGFFLVHFSISSNRVSKNEINILRRQEEMTVSKARELDRKALLTKGHIETWNTKLSKEMKTADGIDVEDIRSILNKIAEKHYILNLNANFSLPSAILPPGKTVSRITNSEIAITFNCLDEYSVYYFLKDLKKENDFAIAIIESLEMKKLTNFDKTFIKALLNNEMRSLFKVTIRLQWYELAEGRK